MMKKNFSRVRFALLTALGLGLTGTLSHRAEAITYYWDANDVAAGSGTAPAGTWGTSVFFNTDAAGGSGTFIASPGATDIARFVAGPVTGMGTYTVDVNGTQSVMGIVVRQTGNLTIGATANASTINLGASGIDNSSRTIVTGNDSGPLTINSTLNLTASQAWNFNNATTGTNPMIVNGNVTGTGDLNLVTSTNKGFTLNGTLNQTGALNSTGSASNGVITVAGAIGSAVTGVTINNNTPTFVAFSNGANAYGGATTVTGGVLRLANTTGSATGTTAITVTGTNTTTFGTVGGTGISTGMLTVGANGHLAPGNNTADATSSGNSGNFGNMGALHVGTVGGLTLNNNATLDFDLTTTAALTTDRIILGASTTATGALTLASGSTLVINFKNITAGNSTLQLNTPYTLLAAANAFTLTNTTITTNFLGALTGLYTPTYSVDAANELQVTFTSAVPEPSTWAMLVGSVALLALARARQSRA